MCRVRSRSGSFMSGSGPKRSGSAKLVQQLYFNLDKLSTIAYLLGLSSWYYVQDTACTGLFYKTCPKKVYSCLSTILKDYIIINIYIYREQSLYLPKHMFTVFCTQYLFLYIPILSPSYWGIIPLYIQCTFTRTRELNKYYCPIHTIYNIFVYCMYK